MAFCTNCGNKLEEGAAFCTNCGAKVDAAPQAAPVAPVAPQAAPQSAPTPQAAPVTGQPGFTFRPQKKKSKAPIVAVVLILVAVAALFGAFALFGGKKSDDPNLGMYYATSMKALGMEMGTGDEWVSLKSGGKAEIKMMDDTYSGKWVCDGNQLTITQHGDEFHGTLENGVMIVDFAGLEYTFVKDGVDVPVLPAETEVQPAEAALDYDWWSGDWYGWWAVVSATGEMAKLEDSFWDCCASIKVNEDGTGEILFWDDECEADECSASGELMIMEGSGEHGSMITTSGSFYDADLSYEWYADPDMEDGVTAIENCISIYASYVDPENTENTFDYIIILRPWGERWEDVASMDTADEIYDDMMPGMYDWYCAQLEKGVTAAPPTIGD